MRCKGRFESLVSFLIQQEHRGMWEKQIAPYHYDCQRLQQEQAPKQWEGRIGRRKQGGRWGGGRGGGNKDTVFFWFPRIQKKKKLLFLCTVCIIHFKLEWVCSFLKCVFVFLYFESTLISLHWNHRRRIASTNSGTYDLIMIVHIYVNYVIIAAWLHSENTDFKD